MVNKSGTKLAAGALTRERFERLQKLNQLFAQGGYTLTELAARFGVSVGTIASDRKYIMEKWWSEEESEKTREKRLRRIKELEQIKRLALESYYRSRMDREEVTTKYDRVPCPECYGTGKLPKCKCLECEGTGYKIEEVVFRKVAGTPGDAQFLQVAKSATVELCKIEALYKQPSVKVQHVVSGGVRHSVDLEEKYSDVDPELILAAKVALARLEDASKVPLIEGEFTVRTEERTDRAPGSDPPQRSDESE